MHTTIIHVVILVIIVITTITIVFIATMHGTPASGPLALTAAAAVVTTWRKVEAASVP